MSTKTLTHVLFQQGHLVNHSTMSQKTLTWDGITETALFYIQYVRSALIQ